MFCTTLITYNRMRVISCKLWKFNRPERVIGTINIHITLQYYFY